MSRKYFMVLSITVLFLAGCTNQITPTMQAVEETQKLVEVEEKATVEKATVEKATVEKATVEKASIYPLAEEIVRELTADKYTGRLVGTEGNQSAAEFLAEQFQSYGLLPLDENGYFQKYTQEVGNSEEQVSQISIVMNDGSILVLVLGTDYVCSIVSEDLNLDIPIVVDPEEDVELPGKCVVIFERGLKSKILCDAMVVVDDTLRFTPHIENGSRKISLSITQNVFEQMKLGGAKRIKIRASNVNHMEEVSNVVGMIPGINNYGKRAVVLTAHFDHCGKQGTSIYSGALDNASGVATMMDVARYVKEIAGEDGLDFDLIVAAVNAEEFWDISESNCAGSRHLASELSDQYSQIYNINFDCVGGMEAGELSLGCMDGLSIPLAKALRESFTCSEIEWNDDTYSDLADHGSFRANKIAAMTVGQINCIPYVHMPTDTYEKIDYENIDLVSRSVAEFIVQKGQEVFVELEKNKNSMKGPDNKEWCEASRVELEKQLAGRELAYDEKYQFIFDGFLTVGTGYHPFIGVDGMHKYYPELEITEEICDFMISEIDIFNYKHMGDIFWSTGNVYDVDQLRKVNKITLNKNEITDIEVEYYNKDRDEYLSFALYPNGMKGTLDVDPVEGKRNMYLLKNEWRETDEYEGYIYKNHGWTAEVRTYHKRYDESSEDYWLDWDSMQKSEDEVLNLIEAIQIDEIADVLIQSVTAQ